MGAMDDAQANQCFIRQSSLKFSFNCLKPQKIGECMEVRTATPKLKMRVVVKHFPGEVRDFAELIG